MEGDKCETPGSAVSSSGETQECFWVYNSSSEITGECRRKNDSDLFCNDIRRQTQCTDGLSGTSLENKCTFDNEVCMSRCGVLSINFCSNNRSDCSWMYSDNNSIDGICYAKNDTAITCKNISNRGTQCEDGGGVYNIIGKCAVYNGVCEEIKIEQIEGSSPVVIIVVVVVVVVVVLLAVCGVIVFILYRRKLRLKASESNSNTTNSKSEMEMEPLKHSLSYTGQNQQERKRPGISF
jgi:hypothetical protein